MTRIQQTLLGMGLAGLVGHWAALGLTNMANAAAGVTALSSLRGGTSLPPFGLQSTFAKDAA